MIKRCRYMYFLLQYGIWSALHTCFTMPVKYCLTDVSSDMLIRYSMSVIQAMQVVYEISRQMCRRVCDVAKRAFRSSGIGVQGKNRPSYPVLS